MCCHRQGACFISCASCLINQHEKKKKHQTPYGTDLVRQVALDAVQDEVLPGVVALHVRPSGTEWGWMGGERGHQFGRAVQREGTPITRTHTQAQVGGSVWGGGHIGETPPTPPHTPHTLHVYIIYIYYILYISY